MSHHPLQSWPRLLPLLTALSLSACGGEAMMPDDTDLSTPGAVDARPARTDFGEGPGDLAGRCANDSDCTGANPRCDPDTSRCVPCLFRDDNCPRGKRCVKAGGRFTCEPGCKDDADCGAGADGGPGARCCDGTCVDVFTNA